jgi:hypothetical protein
LPTDRATERDEFLVHARGHAANLAETVGPYQQAARDLAAEVDRATGK